MSREKGFDADKRKEEILKLLAEGRSIRSVAKEWGKDYVALHKWCLRHGIRVTEVKAESKTRSIKENAQLAASLYASGLSVDKVKEAMGVSESRGVVDSWIKAGGETVRGRGPSSSIVNERAFQKIDTPEKAYWLGVVASDGCVGSGQKTVSLTVKADDVEWVECFKRFLGSGVRITFIKNQWSGAAQFVVTSEYMWNDLVALGVVPKKSKILGRVGDGVPLDLKKHFWRGVVDGDGSLAKDVVNISICSGSKEFAESIREYMGLFGVPFTYEDNGVEKVVLRSDAAVKMIRELYGDSRFVALRRKQNRALDVLGVKRQPRNGLMMIGLDVARVFIDKHHYLGGVKPSRTYGWFEDDVLVGVAAVGSCSSPSVAESVWPGNPEKVRELNRFCLSPGANVVASKFLSEVMDQESLLTDVWAVVAYADPAQGHEGTIYKAANGVEVESSGLSQIVVVTPDGKRFTGRQDVIVNGVTGSGFTLAECSMESAGPKKKFVFVVGSPSQRRERRVEWERSRVSVSS